MRHPSPCRDKTSHLAPELSTSTKNRCFRNSDFHAGLNRLRGYSERERERERGIEREREGIERERERQRGIERERDREG